MEVYIHFLGSDFQGTAMGFSESTKLKVKRLAHFKCCVCETIGIEIHHILPLGEGGSDDSDNAAPLCPTCHEIYGGNPSKRKFIREKRDFWYEQCEKQIAVDDRLLDEIRNMLQVIPTKEDLYSTKSAIVSSVRKNITNHEQDIEDIIYAWGASVDLQDDPDGLHIERVSKMTENFGRLLGFQGSGLTHLIWGAILHDIGKAGVPDSILLKPGRLNSDEFEYLKQHTTLGYRMLQDVPVLRLSAVVPYSHHEKWDGTGYPRNLKGENIPLEARLFAIIDIWDAFTTSRPYKPAWSVDKSIKIMQDHAGSVFDPEVFKVFSEKLEAITIDQKITGA